MASKGQRIHSDHKGLQRIRSAAYYKLYPGIARASNIILAQLSMSALPVFRQVPAFYGTPVSCTSSARPVVTPATSLPRDVPPGSPLTSISDGDDGSENEGDGASVKSVDFTSSPIGYAGIPKPAGTVGASGSRGGYSLQLALNWSEPMYKRFLASAQDPLTCLNLNCHP